MIAGAVNLQRDAIVLLTVRGPEDREEALEAVVDTGYNGQVSLPALFVTRLGLPWDHSGRGFLADGSETAFPVYKATVVWDGAARVVDVDQIETAPLIGMAMLDGYKLTIDVRQGGSVTIESQASPPPG
jgi:clan AA aspartic protease